MLDGSKVTVTMVLEELSAILEIDDENKAEGVRGWWGKTRVQADIEKTGLEVDLSMVDLGLELYSGAHHSRRTESVIYQYSSLEVVQLDCRRRLG